MSVKNVSEFQLLPGPGGRTSRGPASEGDNFASRLEEIENRPERRTPALSRAALEARLLSLSMTSALLDDSTGVRDYFPSLHLSLASRLPDRTGFGRAEGSHYLDYRNTPLAKPATGEQKPSAVTPTGPKSSLDEIIERAAEHHGVDRELVRAVVRTESNFDPGALSPAGAQGLMQLMPDTARELGVSDPFDPEQNIMGGTRYLRQLLDRYEGDLDRTLAAYNWGMGNVERKGLGQMPRETRNYLARVKAARNDAG